jgi:hypothetical protein
MRQRWEIALIPVLVAGQVVLPAADPAASDHRQTPAASSAATGTANGTLTVGAATIKLTRAYVFPERDPSSPSREGYRILVTDRPLTPAAIRFAASAGSNDADRQQLAVEMADTSIRGIEAVVSADRRVTRTNVYSADTAMGLTMLQPTEFSTTADEPARLGGRLFTSAPIQDARIGGLTIRFDVTFTAPVHGRQGL